MGSVHAVGSPGTVGKASGGRIFAYNNVSTTPQQILGIDPQRVSFTVHNPGTVDIFIAPLDQAILMNQMDAPLTPSVSALGGCFRVYANGGELTIGGECQKGWQAFCASGSGNPLTVMVSRI